MHIIINNITDQNKVEPLFVELNNVIFCLILVYLPKVGKYNIYILEKTRAIYYI